MKKKIYIVLSLALIALVIGYNYIYKDHRDIENETSSFKVTTTDLANEFSINPSTAEDKYLNKVVEVTGTITEVNSNDITVDHVVFCQLNSEGKFIINNTIKLKGRVIGYDDLLEQIKLDQCYIINN